MCYNDCTVKAIKLIFSAQQHICYSIRLSVRLSYGWMTWIWDKQSKTVEVRIMQLSPHNSPVTLSFRLGNFTAKFQGNIGSGSTE